MQKQSVLLAMSGGTDSSVSALMLKNDGYNVIGLHISFFGKLWASAAVMAQQEQSKKKRRRTL